MTDTASGMRNAEQQVSSAIKSSQALLKVQTWVDAQKQAGKPALAFCIYRESRIPDEYFREIYKEIKDDFSILTLSGLTPSLFAMPGEVFPLPSDELAFVRGVDIFLVTVNEETLFSKIPAAAFSTLLKQGKLKAAKEHDLEYSSYIDVLLTSIDALLER